MPTEPSYISVLQMQGNLSASEGFGLFLFLTLVSLAGYLVKTCAFSQRELGEIIVSFFFITVIVVDIASVIRYYSIREQDQAISPLALLIPCISISAMDFSKSVLCYHNGDCYQADRKRIMSIIAWLMRTGFLSIHAGSYLLAMFYGILREYPEYNYNGLVRVVGILAESNVFNGPCPYTGRKCLRFRGYQGFVTVQYGGEWANCPSLNCKSQLLIEECQQVICDEVECSELQSQQALTAVNECLLRVVGTLPNETTYDPDVPPWDDTNWPSLQAFASCSECLVDEKVDHYGLHQLFDYGHPLLFSGIAMLGVGILIRCCLCLSGADDDSMEEADEDPPLQPVVKISSDGTPAATSANTHNSDTRSDASHERALQNATTIQCKDVEEELN